MLNKLRWILPSFVILCIAAICVIITEIRSLKKKNKLYSHYIEEVEKGYRSVTPLLGGLTMPLELQNVPLGEKTSGILNVHNVKIRGVDNPYNASLLKQDDHYLLIFRYDEIEQNCKAGFYSYIGYVELDENFQQTEREFRTIDTGSTFSEDPRIVRVGDDLYLSYNDLLPFGHNARAVHVGKLNLEEAKLEYATALNQGISEIEKNWMPFEYVENGKPELYFEYYPNPHKIMKLSDPRVNRLDHLIFENGPAFQRLYWPHLLWGKPRGGTPPLKIEAEDYFAFFHSMFRDRYGIIWYVMGAYTFETKPPFRIKSISNYPILFDGIYDSAGSPDPSKRVIFPAGFCMETKNGKELIHLACGENDAAVKIVTFDKKVLLKSLRKIR